MVIPTAPAAAQPPPVTVAGLNHISVESADSQALAHWYHSVLGFGASPEVQSELCVLIDLFGSLGCICGAEILPRPPFPFGGAWLLAAGVTIHIIDRDPEFEAGQLPLAEARRDAQTAERVRNHATVGCLLLAVSSCVA